VEGDVILSSRRSFITGLGALFIAAPAIVRATSIMPVKALEDSAFEWSPFYTAYPVGIISYDDLVSSTRKAFVPRLFVSIYETSPILSALGLDNQLRSD
jgi:hypothetical protein